MSARTEVWPSHFPIGVPPSDATVPSGWLFRLVDTLPPSAEDFKSHFELYPGRDWGVGIVQAHGVSFHADVADSEKVRRRFKPLRNKRIARGQLTAHHGRMKKTPSTETSHLTVWFLAGAAPYREPWQEGE